MRARRSSAAALLSLAVLCSAVNAAEPPRQLYLPGYDAPRQDIVPPKAVPGYVKKDTWHETMVASLKAVFASEVEKDQAAVGGFRAAIVRLAADGQPVRLEFRVAGLQRLYFATLGRLADGSGSAYFLSPRLFDKQGRGVELAFGGPMMEGTLGAGEGGVAEVTIGGITHRGFALAPGEVAFKLDGEYERLEVLVCYRPERGLPPYAAVDCRPVFARAMERRRIRQSLWDQVARDFRDRQSQIEMEMERRDGIWNEYSPEGSEAPGGYYLARAGERCELARKTLQLVERIAPRPRMAAELRALEQRLERARHAPRGETLRAEREEDERKLFAQAVDLRRRILFSHPALDFDRLLISKRPPPVLSAPGDNYLGMHNGAGPGLVILDQWKTDRPKETVLLDGKLPVGCAMHADLSFDGQRIVFAFADHGRPRDLWQFFLYEIGVDGSGLRQITGRSDDPLTGSGGRMTVLPEDYDPCYLPDGGIAFISTRNQGGVRCHNGDRYCPTYLLYRCDADGSNVRQLSFGEANEWDPVVMPDGRVLWTRWDYINRPVIPTLGLWTIRPDGTAASHYFGNYTPNPCRICQARPIPGSHKVVATAAGHHTIHAGSLIVIDRTIAEDGLEAITRLTPEATFPESEAHATCSFGSPYPLSEDLFLAEFSPDPYPGHMAWRLRHNAYGIYLVDTLGGRELIYRDPEMSCFEPIPVRPRSAPPALPSLARVPHAPREEDRHAERDENKGVFILQDIYRSTRGIERGTIRRLRVNQIIPQPTQRVPYSSAVTFEVLKRVLGTVPVDENGSVAFEAPAGVPLQFQALDGDGMAVMTMRTFTHLQPGEQAGCVGCHEHRTSSPAIRSLTAAQPVLKIEPPVGPRYPGGLSFAKTVQPVLDRYCIECHGLRETAGKIDLLGTIDASDENIATSWYQLLPSAAYASLTRDGRWVKIAQYGGETWYSQPKDYFAHGGTLAALLLKGHQKVTLDAESRQRIIDWLDLNAPFYGTYSWNKDEWRRPDPAGEKALREHVRRRFGDALARQPFAALVNVALPEESRILKAPLAISAGGWGQIEQGGWKSTDDPDYRKMHQLVQAAIQPLPYRDIAGTCGRDENCLCLSCWVRKVMEERQTRITAAR